MKIQNSNLNKFLLTVANKLHLLTYDYELLSSSLMSGSSCTMDFSSLPLSSPLTLCPFSTLQALSLMMMPFRLSLKMKTDLAHGCVVTSRSLVYSRTLQTSLYASFSLLIHRSRVQSCWSDQPSINGD